MNFSGHFIYKLMNKRKDQLIEQKNLFKAVFEQSPVGITYGNARGQIMAANSKFSQITGWKKDELIKMNWHDITHPDDLDKDIALYSRFLSGEIPGFTMEKRYLCKNGSYIWTQITVAPLTIPSNPDVKNICMVEDISERKRITAQLQESEHNKDVLLKNMRGMAYRCKNDQNWTMLYVSYGCKELTGWDAESMINNREVSYNDLISPGYRQSMHELWEKIINAQKTFKMEYPIVTKSGEMKWVLEQGVPVTDENDVFKYLEGLVIDVTDRKLHELEIEYLSQHDVLTGLYNRRFFEVEMQHLELESQVPISILIGDINGLKLINDAFGLEAGDRLIREAAVVISEYSQKSDIVSRTGGDEFTIIMLNTDEQAAYSHMKFLKDRFTAYNETLGDETLWINISFGYGTKNIPEQSLVSVLNTAEDYMRKHKLLEKKSLQNKILASIQATMYERSQETEAHAERMVNLSLKVGHKMGLAQIDLDKLILLAKLHDIGKISIDNRILSKPGKLSAEEWVEMKKHPETGYRIAANSPELIAVADAILSHHERWDGQGYPQGLKGEEIPLLSRVLSIVDAFDAMTENRSYRKAISKDEALTEIERCTGSQFDPHIAHIFVQMVRDHRKSIEE